MSHHTKEQVEKAFAKAPWILNELKKMKIPFPTFQLHEDASGILWLGEKPTKQQYERARDLIHSERIIHKNGEVGIQFCCGLVDHVK